MTAGQDVYKDTKSKLTLQSQGPSSPLPTKWSSYTSPADGQTHPSPPSGHPAPLLVVKLTPLHPAVILTPCWRSNSPLLAVKLTPLRAVVILQPFWRSSSPLSVQWSSSTPSGGQAHPSPSSGHPPPLLAVKFTLFLPAVILNPCCGPPVILHPCWLPTSVEERRETR